VVVSASHHQPSFFTRAWDWHRATVGLRRSAHLAKRKAALNKGDIDSRMNGGTQRSFEAFITIID